MKPLRSRHFIIALLLGVCLCTTLSPALADEPSVPEFIPRVNINTANEHELSFLPGVGPKTSAAIIKYRNRRPFAKSSDIIRVKGIGRKTFRKLRPFLIVAGPTTARAKISLKG